MKKWYAVIGDPIAHSLSPVMHEEWFRLHGIDASFIPIRVKPGELKLAVDAMKRLGVSGFNVTLPFKQEIVPLLDELSPAAITMNAVNTVVCKDGRLYGTNTDGDGFVRSLPVLPKDAAILMVGAGGAARGITFALKRHGFGDITITNRTARRAEELAGSTGTGWITVRDAEEQLGKFDLIINTTSAGMGDGALPMATGNLRSGASVCDIIYTPLETPLLRQAKDRGCSTQNGVGMFVHQGAIAFEEWTGITPDTDGMIDNINRNLGGTYADR
ncbi:shikimate dehydrogenase [Indiicoccus explosivorum]|uniref:shikimate dehydrogenase n=1 Tax=Indiicoccus explosivorum TaxID=1917864 RepID=UPI000B43148D|nr:shikimate dehydrogenase [Indiicoccus explosivorum]